MCVRKCLCNSCYKINTCNDCDYIKYIDKCNCNIDGITKCDYYINPPVTTSN